MSANADFKDTSAHQQTLAPKRNGRCALRSRTARLV
jgi:hypothetical protein